MVFEIGHLQIIRQTTNEELHEFLKIYCDRETMQFIQDGNTAGPSKNSDIDFPTITGQLIRRVSP